VADLAADLRLRPIDLLGLQTGAAVALELAATKPELVRRLVLVGLPSADGLSLVKQRALIMRTRLEAADTLPGIKKVVPNCKVVEMLDVGHDLFEAAPQGLVKQLASFLGGRA
jgi:pimeloyl-ACP methyl ester carboxylesterase